MTRADILIWLEQAESPIVSFDTNALFGNQSEARFGRLCNTLNRINRLRAPRQIRKVLSAAVYLEKVHDLRQQFGKPFDPSLVDGFLTAKGIEILSFDRRDAEHAAALIGERYPSRDAWHAFKRTRCLDCLGLGQYAAHAQGSGQSCGATIDWLVAGHADGNGHLLVTDDSGPEFGGITRKARLGDVCAAADTLLEQLMTEHGA